MQTAVVTLISVGLYAGGVALGQEVYENAVKEYENAVEKFTECVSNNDNWESCFNNRKFDFVLPENDLSQVQKRSPPKFPWFDLGGLWLPSPWDSVALDKSKF